MSLATLSLSEVTALDPLLLTVHCKASWLLAKAGTQEVPPPGPVSQEGAGAVLGGLTQMCFSTTLAEKPNFSLVFVEVTGGGGSEE